MTFGGGRTDLMARDCETIHACRSCEAPGLLSVLDLGMSPLANRLPTEAELGEPEPSFPLHLVLCPACTLLQIDQTVSPVVLFREYLYFSSISPALLRHSEQAALKHIASR